MGTTAGTVWYINWHDNSIVRLLGGHGNKVLYIDWTKLHPFSDRSLGYYHCPVTVNIMSPLAHMMAH